MGIHSFQHEAMPGKWRQKIGAFGVSVGLVAAEHDGMPGMVSHVGRKHRAYGQTGKTVKSTVRWTPPTKDRIEAAAEALGVSRDLYVERLMAELHADERLTKQGWPALWDEFEAKRDQAIEETAQDPMELPLKSA